MGHYKQEFLTKSWDREKTLFRQREMKITQGWVLCLPSLTHPSVDSPKSRWDLKTAQTGTMVGLCLVLTPSGSNSFKKPSSTRLLNWTIINLCNKSRRLASPLGLPNTLLHQKSGSGIGAPSWGLPSPVEGLLPQICAGALSSSEIPWCGLSRGAALAVSPFMCGH